MKNRIIKNYFHLLIKKKDSGLKVHSDEFLIKTPITHLFEHLVNIR